MIDAPIGDVICYRALEDYADELDASLFVLQGEARDEAARELLAVRQRQLEMEREAA